MLGLTVRISERSHQTLRQMAHQKGESMQATLDKAVEEYRRRIFLEQANAAFAALKSDRSAWQEEQAERHLWDAATIADDQAADE